MSSKTATKSVTKIGKASQSQAPVYDQAYVNELLKKIKLQGEEQDRQIEAERLAYQNQINHGVPALPAKVKQAKVATPVTPVKTEKPSRFISQGVTGKDLKRDNKENSGRTGVKKVKKVKKTTEPVTPAAGIVPKKLKKVVTPSAPVIAGMPPEVLAFLTQLMQSQMLPNAAPVTPAKIAKVAKVVKPAKVVIKKKSRFQIIAEVMTAHPDLNKDEACKLIDKLHAKETGTDGNMHQTTGQYLLTIQVLDAFGYWPLKVKRNK